MEIEIDKIFFPCFLLISSLPLFGGCGEGLEQVGRFTFLMSGTEELSGAFSSRGADWMRRGGCEMGARGKTRFKQFER
jgi:hypothetical protein